MNIIMMTNTYLPHVGGVARSVASFAEHLRRRGHAVLVVAPTFDGAEQDETNVVRVPAIQHFNGSDFSVRLPIPGLVSSSLDAFEADLVHAHHPFLMGDTALRAATWRNLPLVFTHHTMYERYTHYVPGHLSRMSQFVVRLATAYANLCDHVVAPSGTVRQVLGQRGVHSPISVVPSGVATEQFRQADGSAARARFGIPDDAFIVGHVGRLAPEKSPRLLAEGVARFLKHQLNAYFLVVGTGSAREQIVQACADHGVDGRLRMAGLLEGHELTNAYRAMNLFAFASQTETQGMVLAEAMAAGVPVVAVDAPGARDIVVDGVNGRLLSAEADAACLAAALGELAAMRAETRSALVQGARQTAEDLSLERCVDRLLAVYEAVMGVSPRHRQTRGQDSAWHQARRLVEAEWNLWSQRSDAALQTLRETSR